MPVAPQPGVGILAFSYPCWNVDAFQLGQVYAGTRCCKITSAAATPCPEEAVHSTLHQPPAPTFLPPHDVP